MTTIRKAIWAPKADASPSAGKTQWMCKANVRCKLIVSARLRCRNHRSISPTTLAARTLSGSRIVPFERILEEPVNCNIREPLKDARSRVYHRSLPLHHATHARTGRTICARAIAFRTRAPTSGPSAARLARGGVK